MGIFDFLKRKTPRVEKKTSSIVWPLQQGSFLEYALGYGGAISNQQAMQFYRNTSAIATCVDKIASRVEQIMPVLKRRGDNKIIVDHPILTLIKSPNIFETYQEFIGKMARHYLLTHDAYIMMMGNTNFQPIELYATKPQNIYSNVGINYYPSSYTISSGIGSGSYLLNEINRTARYYDGQFKELYHIMGFSSRADETSADSPLEAAALETRQLIKGKLHNVSLLDNGGRLSLIIGFKDSDGIDDDEHKIRKKRIQEDLGGSSNAGKIAVISGDDMFVEEVGVSNKDMDFAELENMAARAIYLRYEIPLPLVSTDATTYNNYQTAILDLYENTVLPLTETLFSGLTRAIMPRIKIEDLYISYDPESIKILMRQMLNEIEQRRKINVESINELRALLPSRESVRGGNVIYQNASQVPVGEDVFTGDELTPEQLAEFYAVRDQT